MFVVDEGPAPVLRWRGGLNLPLSRRQEPVPLTCRSSFFGSNIGAFRKEYEANWSDIRRRQAGSNFMSRTMPTRSWWCLVSRNAAEWSWYAVGRLLLDSLIDWCIWHQGIRIFDLTAGDEPYKREWTDHSLALYEYIEPRSYEDRRTLSLRRMRDRLKRQRGLRNLVRYLKLKAAGIALVCWSVAGARRERGPLLRLPSSFAAPFLACPPFRQFRC